MKKLTKSTRSAARRKIRTSTSAEAKFLAAIKRLCKIKLPKTATLDDYKQAAESIDFDKLLPHIKQYVLTILKSNRVGFQDIVTALARGKSGNKKLQERLDKGFESFVQEQKIYKPLLNKFQNNVKLIKNIPDEVAKHLQEAYAKGVSFRGTDIEKYLTETMGKRAKLIVRTESSKLNSALTEVRARNLGINAYIWSTSIDRRVRPSHKLMDGVLLFWNNVPTLDGMTGHAGEFPNCRCVGLPLVEIDDIQFPVKVAEGNLVVKSKYIKGTHGKGYDTQIISGQIKTYNRNEFIRKFGKLFL